MSTDPSNNNPSDEYIRITPAPYKPLDYHRDSQPQSIPDRHRPMVLPEPELRLSFWERFTLGINDIVEKTVYYWKVAKFGAYALSSLIKLKWELAAMNNDKKTTILGWAKGILVTVISIFLADKIQDPSGFSNLVVGAAGSIWGIVEVIQGIFTNKADKK
jgi:hypothetical protein